MLRYIIMVLIIFGFTSCKAKISQNKKAYTYSEFINICTFKIDIKKSVELLKLNEVNSLNFTHNNNAIQLKNESILLGCISDHKPRRYIFKIDLDEDREIFVLIISSLGPTGGDIFIYDKYLNLLKEGYVGHVDKVEIVQNTPKSLLKLSHYSHSGTDADEYDIAEFSF